MDVGVEARLQAFRERRRRQGAPVTALDTPVTSASVPTPPPPPADSAVPRPGHAMAVLFGFGLPAPPVETVIAERQNSHPRVASRPRSPSCEVVEVSPAPRNPNRAGNDEPPANPSRCEASQEQRDAFVAAVRWELEATRQTLLLRDAELDESQVRLSLTAAEASAATSLLLAALREQKAVSDAMVARLSKEVSRSVGEAKGLRSQVATLELALQRTRDERDAAESARDAGAGSSAASTIAPSSLSVAVRAVNGIALLTTENLGDARVIAQEVTRRAADRGTTLLSVREIIEAMDEAAAQCETACQALLPRLGNVATAGPSDESDAFVSTMLHHASGSARLLQELHRVATDDECLVTAMQVQHAVQADRSALKQKMLTTRNAAVRMGDAARSAAQSALAFHLWRGWARSSAVLREVRALQLTSRARSTTRDGRGHEVAQSRNAELAEHRAAADRLHSRLEAALTVAELETFSLRQRLQRREKQRSNLLRAVDASWSRTGGGDETNLTGSQRRGVRVALPVFRPAASVRTCFQFWLCTTLRNRFRPTAKQIESERALREELRLCAELLGRLSAQQDAAVMVAVRSSSSRDSSPPRARAASPRRSASATVCPPARPHPKPAAQPHQTGHLVLRQADQLTMTPDAAVQRAIALRRERALMAQAPSVVTAQLESPPQHRATHRRHAHDVDAGEDRADAALLDPGDHDDDEDDGGDGFYRGGRVAVSTTVAAHRAGDAALNDLRGNHRDRHVTPARPIAASRFLELQDSL
jgi:hypothetical protein